MNVKALLARVLATTLLFSSIPITHAQNVSAESAGNTEVANEQSTQPQELENKRTEFSKTYQNSDGTLTTEVSQKPIHYKEGNQWVPIDNELVENSTEQTIENKANSLEVKFEKNMKPNGEAFTVSEDGQSITVSPVEKQVTSEDEAQVGAEVKASEPATSTGSQVSTIQGEEISSDVVTGAVKENTVTYEDYEKNIDLQYTVESDRVKEDIILQEKPAADVVSDFTFKIKLENLSYEKKADGRIYFTNLETGKEEFFVEKPFMYDSYKPEGFKVLPNVTSIPEEALSYDVEMDAEKVGEELFIHVKPNKDWLLDNKRVYPVVIDPTIVRIQPKTSISDTNIRSLYPTQTGGAETTLGVGLAKGTDYSNIIRSLLKFDVSSIPQGAKILNAELNLWLASVYNNTVIDVGLHEVSKSWTEAGSSWNSRDGVNAWTTQGGDYNQTPIATMPVAELTDLSMQYRWNITDLVNKWVATPSSNNGVILKSNTETTATYKKFISGDDVNNPNYTPLLAITYYPMSRLGVEDYWTYDSQNITNGTQYTNLTTGNNIAQYTDFSIPARGSFGIDFTRTYNSKSIDDSVLGYGWTFSGNETVFDKSTSGKSDRVYTDADGTAHVFQYNSTTQKWDSPKGKYLTMTDVTNSSGLIIGFMITDKYGIKTYFELEKSDNTQINIMKGRIKYSEDTHGNRITYNYDTSNRLSSIVDPSGRVLSFTYNANGKIEVATFEGRTFKYWYNGNKLQYVDQYKNATEYVRTTFQYNSDGYLATIIDANGRKTDFIYDEVRKEFLKRVQLPSLDSSSTDSDTRPYTEYVFDTINKLATVTDPKKNVTQYYYNENFVPVKIVDASGGVTQYELDDNYNPLNVIDPMGYITNATYDSKGNVLTSTDAEGNKSISTYGPFSNLLTYTSPNGELTTNNYNSKGDLTSTINAKEETTSYTYDSYGNIETVTYPNNTVETYIYDDLKNYVKSIKDSTGKILFTATQDEVGNTTSIIDAEGNETKTPTDNRDVIELVEDPNLKQTDYEYDDAGNLEDVTNANGKKEDYINNGQGLPLKVIDPLLKTTVIAYDGNGNTETVTPPSGNIITYTYTSLNQVEDVLVNGVKRYHHTYDKNGNLKTVTDSSGKVIASYDYYKNNLLKVEGDTVRSNTYTYNKNGFITNVLVSTGSSTFNLGYVPNELGQLSALKKDGTIFANFEYNKLGQLDWKSIENGLVYIDLDYDTANRLKTYQVKRNGVNGEILYSYTFGYDLSDNIKTVTTPSGIISYDYDDLNQLKSETTLDDSTITYEYDNAGNRTAKTVTKNGQSVITTYVPNDANQIQSVNGVSYTYDANGNLTNDNNRTFVYNEFNELIEIKDNTGKRIASYQYDDTGRRISKTDASGTITNYHYLGDKVIYETDANGTVTTEYTWDSAGNPVTMKTGGKTYYYHVNYHGDVVALSDSSGAIVASYTYDAFGNLLSSSGSMANKNPYRYAGYRYDEESKLYYLMARYYNPEHGAFISRDPVFGKMDEPLTQNGYNYVSNNPVMYVDPSGEYQRDYRSGEPGYELGQTTADWLYGTRKTTIDWKPGVVSKSGETRTQHVRTHGRNMLQKKDHGVFYGDPIKVTNKAWKNRGRIKPIVSGTTHVFHIPYPNAGYAGGWAGNGGNLNYVTIVVERGTNKIITAFPSRGR